MARAIWKFLHGAPDFTDVDYELFATETFGDFSGPATQTRFTYADPDGNKIFFKGDFIVNNGVVDSGIVSGFDCYEGAAKVVKAHGYAFSFAELTDAFNNAMAHASGPFQELLDDGKTKFKGSHDGDNIFGTDNADRIFGKGGDDFLSDDPNGSNLSGNYSRDYLNGGKGDDFIWSGEGKNILAGGPGSDTFVFVYALGAPNKNKITDFSVHKDMIVLDMFNGFGALTPGDAVKASEFHVGQKAADADDYLIYNRDSGAFLYDADGLGGAAAVKFGQVTPGLDLTHSNFAVGDFD